MKNLRFLALRHALVVGMAMVSFFSTLATSVSDSQASKDAMVVSGNARFTVLTPGMVRMEWDSAARFTDDASLLVENRRLPVPQFTSHKAGKWVTIKTKDIELKYLAGSGRFTRHNLNITYTRPDGKRATWHWGDKQTGNLKGTYRTLDTYDGSYSARHKITIPMEDGLLARDGWTLIDDSKNMLFDNDTTWRWVKPRRDSVNAQDAYFMVYGHDYKRAITDYTRIAGKIPLPPKYTFGFWWSRYWNYSDNDLRTLVQNFRRYDIPIDVLVIDMDWHETDSLFLKPVRRDETGSKLHWTGWTWEKHYFPHPDKFLKWTDAQQLKTTLNLHPASGIPSFEEPYGRFCKAMGLDSTTRQRIPYEGSNKRFMTNLFEVVLDPISRMGVDFWWLDWQQFLTDHKYPSLSNTWWINYVFFSRMERTGTKRPLLYHRWGGLGNHRYQIGFSGDAVASWRSLAFQPWFTATASNVLYSYWSHDIGGHYLYADHLDPDLYVRWVQYGTFSPILRIHSNKNSRLNKDPWVYDKDHFDALRDAIDLRYRLVPYIYTMARCAYDTGIGLCRPMYYDYPESPEAYADSSQYMFGDQMLVSAIGAPADSAGIFTAHVWLPQGNRWFEWSTGTLLNGGQSLDRKFTLSEYPVYVKAGAVIPMYGREVRNLQSPISAYTLAVMPGASGEGTIYEDAGDDKQYATRYATTRVVNAIRGRTQTLTIEPTRGEFDGMELERTYTIYIYGAEMPETVTVDGIPYTYSSLDTALTRQWRYDGNRLAVVVPIGVVSASATHTVTVTYSSDRQADVNTGIVGRLHNFVKAYRDYKASLKKRTKGWNWVTDEIGRVEETARILEYEPQNFYDILLYFNNHVDNCLRQFTFEPDKKK